MLEDEDDGIKTSSSALSRLQSPAGSSSLDSADGPMRDEWSRKRRDSRPSLKFTASRRGTSSDSAHATAALVRYNSAPLSAAHEAEDTVARFELPLFAPFPFACGSVAWQVPPFLTLFLPLLLPKAPGNTKAGLVASTS
jgi:hypothetical protein